MKQLMDDPYARKRVIEDCMRIANTLGEDPVATQAELGAYMVPLEMSKDDSDIYLTSRGAKEVAEKLSLTATHLIKLLHGKSVLDIGCGTGQFAADIARDKSISVTALDIDEELLDRVPDKPNITKVHGDGYDLAASGIEAGSFDAVFATYSTNYWARNAVEVAQSIDEANFATAQDGHTFLTPLIQDLDIADAHLHHLRVPGNYNGGLAFSKVRGILAVTAVYKIALLEASGEVDAIFRSSSKNKQFPKLELDDGRKVAPNSFSVILQHKTTS